MGQLLKQKKRGWRNWIIGGAIIATLGGLFGITREGDKEQVQQAQVSQQTLEAQEHEATFKSLSIQATQNSLKEYFKSATDLIEEEKRSVVDFDRAQLTENFQQLERQYLAFKGKLSKNQLEEQKNNIAQVEKKFAELKSAIKPSKVEKEKIVKKAEVKKQVKKFTRDEYEKTWESTDQIETRLRLINKATKTLTVKLFEYNKGESKNLDNIKEFYKTLKTDFSELKDKVEKLRGKIPGADYTSLSTSIAQYQAEIYLPQGVLQRQLKKAGIK